MTTSPKPSAAMTIQITLTPEQRRKLAMLARARGQDPADHARDVVAAYLQHAGGAGPTPLHEILALVWEGWRRSGLAEGKVDDLLEQEFRGARDERRRAP